MVLAVTGAAALLAQAVELDWAERLLNVGLIGVFLVVLFGGRVIVLRREKDEALAASEQRLSEAQAAFAAQEQLRKEQITRTEAREAGLREKNDELTAFIRETLIERQDELLQKQIDLIRAQAGLDPPGERR